jgi:hypothetical protein
MSRKLSVIWIFFLATIIVGSFLFLKEFKVLNSGLLKKDKVPVPAAIPKPSSLPKPKATKEPQRTTLRKIPNSYLIKHVSFTKQAPYGIWDHDHNEACEEASILTVHFYNRKRQFTPAIADKYIMRMVNYQKRNWGGHFDLEAKEIVQLAEEFFSYKNTKVVYDISFADLKREISKGNPVIIPTAGRMLNNPNYRRLGPLYHNLVAIGYTQNKIITNDPGSNVGDYYSFDKDILMKSLHEWNNGKVYQGRSAMIIIK